MPSHVHEIDPVTVELEVEVPWERVRKGLDASFGKLQKNAKIRGFRPGKVPRSVLNQLFGSQVRNEVVATLVEEGLLTAVQQHELAVVAQPRVDKVPTIQEGEPLSFKATLEVRPKIDSIDTDALEVVRATATVSESDVDQEIEHLRERQAEIITPDPMRPARSGDRVTVDYTVEIDAEERPEMGATQRHLELGSGVLLPEFEEGLTGKQPGDEVQIRVAFGEDAKEELRNKRALFKVAVRELREKVLPAIDDELAQEVSEHETLEALRADLREQLEKSARERAEESLREQLVSALVERNPIPVPPSLVAMQEKSMREELGNLMRMTRRQADALIAEMGMKLRAQAEKKVRAGLLMGELARREGIGVEPAEVDARLARIAEQTGKHIAKVRVDFSGERREALESKILEDKLLDYLKARARVTDAPAERQQEPAPQDAPEE